ncbi:hypothetical protein DFP72DRAFT_784107, partial [Ephemerocybe angulata]
SKAYDHFEYPEARVTKGQVNYLFRCKKFPEEVVSRRRTDESTSNLVRHVKACEAGVNPEQVNMFSAFVNGITFDYARHRVGLALWCARAARPNRIVEDPELIKCFTDIYPKVKMPSRMTIARDTKEIHQLTKEHIVEMLQEHPGKIHVGADGWTSPNVYSFLGVTIHW